MPQTQSNGLAIHGGGAVGRFSGQNWFLCYGMVRPPVALVTPGSPSRGFYSLRGVPRLTNLRTSKRATAPTKATKIVAAKP
jgi:hypothetical protein